MYSPHAEFRLNGTTYRVLYPELLRPLSPAEWADLEQSVRAGDVQTPIFVDEGGGLIVGYHRCAVSARLGLAEVPVHVLAGLTPERKRELAFELNDCRRQQSDQELSARREARAAARAAVEAALLAEPTAGPRAIADKVQEATGKRPGKNTVARVRGQLARAGKADQLERTKGKDGKSRPAGRVIAPSVTRVGVLEAVPDTPAARLRAEIAAALEHMDEQQLRRVAAIVEEVLRGVPASV
jgi:hypothetical protein